MVSRRELITAGVAGTLTTAAPARSLASGEEQEANREGQREIARQIQNVEEVLRSAYLSPSLSHGVIARLRSDFETFIRANQKFPDFIEVGVAVFWEIYDWHVKHQQQVMVTRLADGRYALQFMFTSLILRPEQDRNFIGIPFDKV